MGTLQRDDPLAVAVVDTIRNGDQTTLRRLLHDHPELATTRITSEEGRVECSRTLLHVATDWPGHYPGVQATIEALLDAGADIDAPGAVIAGGTPLDDAVAFGQWHAAHRLVARGARTALWHAAALGLMDRIERHFAGPTTPARHPWGAQPGVEPPDEVTVAFWCACHGG